MNQKPDPDKLAQVVAESAHQIWLAGLSALSMAEKESGKFFETLSKLSDNIQAQTVKTADVAKKTVSGGKDAATGTWDKLEELFELRVGRALNALQIPTARDIKELTKRVDKLSKSVAEISASDVKAAKPRKKKSKSAKKRSTKKKSLKKKAEKKKARKKKAKTDKKKTARSGKKRTRK